MKYLPLKWIVSARVRKNMSSAVTLGRGNASVLGSFSYHCRGETSLEIFYFCRWCSVFLFSFFTYFYFLAALPDMWDLILPTRDWTSPPAVEAWSLNHWTAREAFHVSYNDRKTDKFSFLDFDMGSKFGTSWAKLGRECEWQCPDSYNSMTWCFDQFSRLQTRYAFCNSSWEIKIASYAF